MLCGCAGRQPFAIIPGPGVGMSGGSGRVANLALGPSAEHSYIAEFFAYRSSWPSASVGYRFDDTSYHTEIIYDDQAFYERLGGGYFRAAETIRTGVLVR
jgi:hypothetical protein